MQKPADMPQGRPTSFRTLFLSDLHLPAWSCQSERLLNFLRQHDAETIYLVGDIIDLWSVRRGARWRSSHTQVLLTLIAMAKAGSRIVYIPGNHDSQFRLFAGSNFRFFEVRLNDIHETASGKRLLIMHGDEFDLVISKARWLALIGDIAYDLALHLNSAVHAVRRLLGLPSWSLSAYLKYRVKKVVNAIGNFEEKLVQEARRQGADGVVCGHIHHAAMQTLDGILYINTGDWVESCTAVAEHHDGSLEIINWLEEMRAAKKAKKRRVFARRRTKPIL